MENCSSVVRARYGQRDWTGSQNGTYVVGPWKFIIKGWDHFFSHIIFEVSDGSSIFFWHSILCDGIRLKDCFPSRFALGADKNALVSGYLEHNSTSVVWPPIFVCEAFLNDDSVAQLFSMLGRASMGDSSCDMVR